VRIAPIAQIRSSWIRKPLLLVAIPALIVWCFNWRLIAFPCAVLWNAAEMAFWAAVESISADLSTRSIRLMRKGIEVSWKGPEA
jgi:hypothetical protein